MKQVKIFFCTIFFAWIVTNTANAQLFPECATISATVIAPQTQSGSYNYFGVRIELDQTYDQNITVEGYIFDVGSPNTTHSFSLTVISGNLTAETATNFYQTGPTEEAAVSVSSVAPLTVTASSSYFSTQCSFVTSNPNLKDFFSSYDTSILRNADTLQPTAFAAICSYMVGKNSDLIQYLNQKAPSTFTIADMDPNDDLVTVAGLIFMYLEDKDSSFKEYSYMRYNNPAHLAFSGPFTDITLTSIRLNLTGFWSCVGDVLLDVVGVGSLYEEYRNLIRTGATWGSVRGIIWGMIRRAAGWWTAVYGTYRIIRDCF